MVPEMVQHGRGRVDGGHLRPGEAPQEGEAAGAGTAAQVQDPAGRLTGSQPADPADHGAQVVVQHLGVEVQEFGQDRLGRLVPGVLMVVTIMGAMVFHASTLRAGCAIDIRSCLRRKTASSTGWSASGSGGCGPRGAGRWMTWPPAAT